MLVVATELHVKSFWSFFAFVKHSVRSMKQAEKSPGIISAKAGNKGWRIGYTLTIWENKEAMQSFRNTGAHKIAMTKIRKLSSKYKTLVWEADAVPDFKEAKERLGEMEYTMLT